MRLHFSIWIILFLTSLGGCYTASEMRQLAEEKPDPRQTQVDQLWKCIQTIAAQEQWPIEVSSRQGLLLATKWINKDAEHRKRTRVSVVVAPMGVAINVHVHLQHRVPGAPEWTDVTDPVVLTDKRVEETALAKRIHWLWEETR